MRLEVPGRPIPKARARRGKGGHFYTPDKTRRYEDDVAWYARLAKVKFTGRVKVSAEFHQRRPFTDGDNCMKSLLDGLQKGGMLRNDVDVCEFYGKRVEVERPEDEKTVVVVEEFA